MSSKSKDSSFVYHYSGMMVITLDAYSANILANTVSL